jgi:hypothetical protein
MLFCASEKFDDRKIKEIADILKFSPPAIDLRALRGILEFHIPLSTASPALAPLEYDDVLVPIALAILRIARDSRTNRWRVLPEALVAFCNGSLAAYTDTHTLGEPCRREGDFMESTAPSIEEYFAARTHSAFEGSRRFHLSRSRGKRLES